MAAKFGLRRGAAAILLIAATPATAAPAANAPASPPAPAAPAPVSNEPGTTSASYGDWVLRCQRMGDGNAAKRICEVAQTIRLQGAPNPVAEVALGRLPTDKSLRLTALLPSSVSFPSTVSVQPSDKPNANAELQWRRCLPGGCFADAGASDDLIKTWRSESGAGKLTFKDGGGRDVALPVSFRGLAQALDALDKS